MKKWKRHCPKCGEEISYSRIYERDRVEKRNTNCGLCAMGSEEMRKKLSKSKKRSWKNFKYREKHTGKNNHNYGKPRSEEVKKKISQSNKGNAPWNKDKKLSNEHKKNMRISALKRIGQVVPNHNPKSIIRIEEEAKKYNIIDLQHAENGGEFQVCGYFVDGYSKKKNIVIEYYEPFHKKQKDRDERRKKEIINELGCKFIEIKE